MAQRMKTDWVLFVTVLVMVGFGLVMVYSSSSVMAELKFGSSTHFLRRQLFWAVVSFAALMFFKDRDYRELNNPVGAFAPLGVVLGLLLLVYFVDPRAHRWFRIPRIGSFQPSEFAKPALILFLAYFVSQKLAKINERHVLWQATLTIAVLALTVVVPDFGTAVVLVGTAAVVFYVAGIERKYLYFALAAGVIAGTGFVVSKPYRLARVINYVDKNHTLLGEIDRSGQIENYLHEASTQDTTYQARQSRIAVGTGGALGVGLMQGKQKLLYLPEAHTDYIYAVVGEELGLWGSSAVLGGFVIILWRGFRLYWTASDDFGKYLALGITCSIVIQAFMNMSVVLDMGPVKGIPLPMISSGGSSLLSTLLSLGLLLNVSENAG
ncbi:MAG: putative peptidoglycan glycosyltransferase FtsW [Bryobacteraceae bacterium]